jgi:hypothetical protein
MGVGKSNKEIAAELQISERTARTHVSNILRKLGLPSRTQAAPWAVRQGLVDGCRRVRSSTQLRQSWGGPTWPFGAAFTKTFPLRNPSTQAEAFE